MLLCELHRPTRNHLISVRHHSAYSNYLWNLRSSRLTPQDWNCQWKIKYLLFVNNSSCVTINNILLSHVTLIVLQLYLGYKLQLAIARLYNSHIRSKHVRFRTKALCMVLPFYFRILIVHLTMRAHTLWRYGNMTAIQKLRFHSQSSE